ncbi:MAG: type II toxin-antitoxin system RelE/ParE family toxin [Chthoniobacterales bacterium]|nr:type II toxin-antitoxin system RelE/ParE family toxin [Chthoniobacterales bacterium]
MIRVRFDPRAREELDAAIAYYEAAQPGLGRRFAEAMEVVVWRVQKNPETYRVIEGEIRQGRVRRFPYGVVFRIHGVDLEIIAVMHLHRRPGYWRSRIGR